MPHHYPRPARARGDDDDAADGDAPTQLPRTLMADRTNDADSDRGRGRNQRPGQRIDPVADEWHGPVLTDQMETTACFLCDRLGESESVGVNAKVVARETELNASQAGKALDKLADIDPGRMQDAFGTDHTYTVDLWSDSSSLKRYIVSKV